MKGSSWAKGVFCGNIAIKSRVAAAYAAIMVGGVAFAVDVPDYFVPYVA